MNDASRHKAPAPPRQMESFDGVLIVDKPAGPTSHDIVAKIRSRFRFKKVGHGGTLDPQATGVLVILIGKGTKMSSRFMSADKTYEGTILLGIATDSYDADGQVVSKADFSSVTRDDLESAMKDLTGDILQIPPMVSAVKVDGVPLYKRARKGQTIEREPRLIHVYELRISKFDLPRAEFIIRCTKGTYVRSICSDIGERLGCGAHLEKLRRTESGDFKIKDAIPGMDLLDMSREDVVKRIIPISDF